MKTEKEIIEEIRKLQIQEDKYDKMLSEGKAVPLKGNIDLQLLEAELKGIQSEKARIKEKNNDNTKLLFGL